MEVRLQVYELSVGILRINRRDYALAPRVGVIHSRAEGVGDLIVGQLCPIPGCRC